MKKVQGTLVSNGGNSGSNKNSPSSAKTPPSGIPRPSPRVSHLSPPRRNNHGAVSTPTTASSPASSSSTSSRRLGGTTTATTAAGAASTRGLNMDSPWQQSSVLALSPRQSGAVVMVESKTAGLAKKRAHVYLAGGWDRKSVLQSMERVTLPSHRVVTKSRMPSPRFDFGYALHDDLILYCAGGHDKHKRLLDSIVTYHMAHQVWTTLKITLSSKRTGVAMAASEGRLYCIGGFDGKQYSAGMQVLDLHTNTWMTKHWTGAPFPEMEQARAFSGICVVEKEIHVFGGENSEDGDLHTVEVYNPHLNTWEEACPMPTPRRKCCATTVEVSKGKASNDLVVVVGGSREREYLRTAEAYHPQQDSWTRLPDMMHRREGCGAVGIGKDLVVFGGASGRFNVQNSMERLRVQKHLKGAMEFYLHDALGMAFSLSHEGMLLGGEEEDYDDDQSDVYQSVKGHDDEYDDHDEKLTTPPRRTTTATTTTTTPSRNKGPIKILEDADSVDDGFYSAEEGTEDSEPIVMEKPHAAVAEEEKQEPVAPASPAQQQPEEDEEEQVVEKHVVENEAKPQSMPPAPAVDDQISEDVLSDLLDDDEEVHNEVATDSLLTLTKKPSNVSPETAPPPPPPPAPKSVPVAMTSEPVAPAPVPAATKSAPVAPSSAPVASVAPVETEEAPKEAAKLNDVVPQARAETESKPTLDVQRNRQEAAMSQVDKAAPTGQAIPAVSEEAKETAPPVVVKEKRVQIAELPIVTSELDKHLASLQAPAQPAQESNTKMEHELIEKAQMIEDTMIETEKAAARVFVCEIRKQQVGAILLERWMSELRDVQRNPPISEAEYQERRRIMLNEQQGDFYLFLILKLRSMIYACETLIGDGMAVSNDVTSLHGYAVNVLRRGVNGTIRDVDDRKLIAAIDKVSVLEMNARSASSIRALGSLLKNDNDKKKGIARIVYFASMAKVLERSGGLQLVIERTARLIVRARSVKPDSPMYNKLKKLGRFLVLVLGYQDDVPQREAAQLAATLISRHLMHPKKGSPLYKMMKSRGGLLPKEPLHEMVIALTLGLSVKEVQSVPPVE